MIPQMKKIQKIQFKSADKMSALQMRLVKGGTGYGAGTVDETPYTPPTPVTPPAPTTPSALGGGFAVFSAGKGDLPAPPIYKCLDAEGTYYDGDCGGNDEICAEAYGDGAPCVQA